MSAHPAAARAEAAIRLRRWEEALREAGVLLAADPSDSTGYAMLARAQLGRRQFAEALKAADEGLRRSPEREWLHRLRAHGLIALQRYGEGLAAADECVRLLPDACEPHLVRGEALQKLKRHADAEEELLRARELNADDFEPHRALGDLWLEKDPQRAEEHYRAALRIDATHAGVLNNLGAALARQKRRDEAALAYKAAILADPALGVAKRNAHAVVTQQVGKAAGWGTGIFALLQAGRLAATASAPIALAFLALGVPAAVVIRKRRREKRMADLKQKDPQLYAIFEKLEQDKKAGRL